MHIQGKGCLGGCSTFPNPVNLNELAALQDRKSLCNIYCAICACQVTRAKDASLQPLLRHSQHSCLGRMS